MKYDSDIEPRRIKFCATTQSKFWYADKDIETYHFNALALFLPTLERMVVLSLRQALTQITNFKLKGQIASLIAQEAIHGSEFVRFNQNMIHPFYSFKTEPQMRLFRFLSRIIHYFSPTFHLALSAAGEHITAVSAFLFLTNPTWFQGVDPKITAIWRWHCIEEIEHKCVAFDTFQALKGRYFARTMGMLIMLSTFMLIYIKPIFSMAWRDRTLKDATFYRRVLRFYFGHDGLCRQIFPGLLRYFRFGFHPRQIQDSHLISNWKMALGQLSRDDMPRVLESEFPPTIGNTF